LTESHVAHSKTLTTNIVDESLQVPGGKYN